ncbi:MAG: MSHA biogenesis protein MshP [Candidatus Azotimanducaceae bacterium]|jgi:MSHA biogenesis protein MshP
MRRIHPAERGFAAISAIFLLVVMAAMGGFMLTFSNAQQLASAQDIKGSQAYWAARAGLEWGMGNVIRQPVPTVSCPNTTENLLGGTVLFDGGFTVVVTCTMSLYTEGPKDRKIFLVTSVANNSTTSGIAGFIERSVSASIEK